MDEKGEKIGNPRDFFKGIVQEMMKKIQENDDTIVLRSYLSDDDPDKDKDQFMRVSKLKNSPADEFGPCRKQLGIRYHPNIICP